MVDQRVDAAEALLAEELLSVEATIGPAELGVPFVGHTPQTLIRRHCSLPSKRLQIAAEGLLALDCLEERLEVAGAEAAGALALDHLEEDRRAVLHILGKDLEQV